MDRRFCAAAARTRLDRGPHRRDRVSLGGGTQRALRRDRGRVRPAQGRCHRHGGICAVPAAKQATSIIPIVFALAVDPVGSGLVASLARPGGNVTGLSALATDLAGKRLELLREVVPGLRRLAIMGNAGYRWDCAGDARGSGRGPNARRSKSSARNPTSRGYCGRLRGAQEPGGGALRLSRPALVNANRIRINTLALGARLPTMYGIREYVEAGRSDVLWAAHSGPVPARRRLCRQDSARREGRATFRSSSRPSSIWSSISQPPRRSASQLPELFLLRADEVIE